MKDLKKIIEDVKSLKDANFVPSDDVILISATNIFLAKRVTPTTSKKPTTNNKPCSKFVIKNPTDPATDKQKHKLDTLGLEYPKEINKGEASKLIEENPEASPTSQDDY